MKKEKPKEFDRDLHIELQWPTLSWSMVSCWEYSKEDWYQRYYLGIRGEVNSAMQMGIDIGESIISDPAFLPTLERPDTYEKTLKASFAGMKIKGHIDGWFDKKVQGIDEYKTSTNKDRWTQKKVDEHRQIDFYCLLRYIHFQQTPESLRLRLWAIPIKEFGDFTWEAQTPICFNTKRSMKDILSFGVYLKQTYKAMHEYIKLKELTI